MIIHYLKIALRNLLKYKVHSFISVVCLAIGITCFSMVNYFVDTATQYENLPDYDRRIRLVLYSEGMSSDIYWRQEDFKYLEELSVSGMDSLVIGSFGNKAEISAIDEKQQEKPFIINYKCVSSSFFSYKNIRTVYGRTSLDYNDGVIISNEFAKKAFGEKDPTGMIIHLISGNEKSSEQIRDYKVVGVVTDEYIQKGDAVDCYFPISMNPYIGFSVASFLLENTSLEELNRQLEQITLNHEETIVHPYAYLLSSNSGNIQRTIAILLFRFLGSLVLLSGLINFLKFIIQMFYNRQRELVLRECLGSDNKGLFYLLFAETFWMMSVAFLLSLAITEVVSSLASIYIPTEDMIVLDMTRIYTLQLTLYVVLLLVCMFVILYPVYRLRRLSIINSFVQKHKNYMFRNIMIGVQLAISVFFVGGVFGTTLIFHEVFKKMYSPLSDSEEKQIVSMSVNSICMKQNIDVILSEINQLPYIKDYSCISYTFDLGRSTIMNYSKDGQRKGNVFMIQGDPHYFEFFNIPMEGKLVEKNNIGITYISEHFKTKLQKEGIEGSITLGGREYQIAGTFKALYKESESKDIDGSVFIVNPNSDTYYFKTSGQEFTDEAIRKMTEICRRYVPETLPLEIRDVSDTRKTINGAIDMMQKVFIILAVISLLLVVLSIYSSITMDTINRQKEVAIRKINGATPKTIAILFGKVYLIIYVISFCLIYPLLKLLFKDVGVETGLHNIYSIDKGILLFVFLALLIFSVTACKIYKVMHLNPADIIKKE